MIHVLVFSTQDLLFAKQRYNLRSSGTILTCKCCVQDPHFLSCFTSFCFPLLSLTVGLVLSVPDVGGRSMPVTGCDVRGGMHTTWPVLRATPARGSCPRERSSAWWRRRSYVGSTTTPWWRTLNEQLRAVSFKRLSSFTKMDLIQQSNRYKCEYHGEMFHNYLNYPFLIKVNY